jgi:hypothetical protein
MRNSGYYTVTSPKELRAKSKEALRLQLQVDTQAFLDSGGSITKIEAGASGTKEGISYLTIDNDDHKIQHKDLKHIL